VLSKLGALRKEEEFLATFYKGLQTLFIVSLGISLFVFLFSYNIIEVLFERGNFFREDTLTVSSLLRYYFFVLLCSPVGAYLSNVYFAYRKTKLAMLYSIISSIINIVLNIVLGYLVGIIGLAIASSVAFLSGNIMQISNISRVNSNYRLSISLIKIFKTFLAGVLCFIIFITINNNINYNNFRLDIFGKLLYVSVFFISYVIVFTSINYVFNVEIVREVVNKILKR
jgi:putative peptidoglycan lipid II flippase